MALSLWSQPNVLQCLLFRVESPRRQSSPIKKQSWCYAERESCWQSWKEKWLVISPSLSATMERFWRFERGESRISILYNFRTTLSLDIHFRTLFHLVGHVSMYSRFRRPSACKIFDNHVSLTCFSTYTCTYPETRLIAYPDDETPFVYLAKSFMATDRRKFQVQYTVLLPFSSWAAIRVH